MNEWDLDARQRKALEYFSQHAGEWRQRAEADRSQRVSTIGQRNDHAIALASSHPERFRSSLDLGCGSGELVFALAELGLDSTGVDYSDQMIELCREKALRLGLGNARFQVGSVMDHDFGAARYDLVTAFGFIEYLRPEQLSQFFARCRRLVSKNGVLQVGSRNRLFNLMSLNQFTAAELGAGTAAELLKESLLLAESLALDSFVESALRDCARPEVLGEYPQTDVDVAGYQYTPAAILRLLLEAGFRITGLSAVHYHGFIPAIARPNPEMHASISNLVHKQFMGDHRLVPYSSSYIVTAE